MTSVLAPRARRPPLEPRLGRFGLAVIATILLGAIAAGLLGVYRYVDNYWVYRGFAPPHDPAYVEVRGTSGRFFVTSPALGGRRQLVDLYLPPGYALHPSRHYPVMYLLHGAPGRPDAFLDTVRMGVVEDEPLRGTPSRSADDPRDALRFDRHVHRHRVGERRRP